MSTRSTPEWTTFQVCLRARPKKRLLAYAKSLTKASADDDSKVERSRSRFRDESQASGYVDRQALLSYGLILSDLAAQGWRLRIGGGEIQLTPPQQADASPLEEKARIRRQELIKRNMQLRQPSVQRFLRDMEAPRLFQDKVISIFSLMRDGRELASRLNSARAHMDNGWAEALRDVVDPFLEFVSSSSATCEKTGLRLMDVWRYFRHTWTNPLTSVPGRSMLFLVRDRAAENHPVMGIGALCSPVMQLRERDTWIGWHPDVFLDRIRKQPTRRICAWVFKILNQAIDEIYVDDLIEDELISVRELTKPTETLVARLMKESVRQRKLHHRFTRQRDHKRPSPSKDEQDTWIARARSHLFRSKRTLALATYLNARMVLRPNAKAKLTPDELAAISLTSRGSNAIRKVLKKAKADRVGICVADISVCGAVQPYNSILGGKLVAMLAASPEVICEYRRRYSNAQSEIASAMAGRAIKRKPNLVLLGTTSLYGIGSSQYNRIRIPCAGLGGASADELRFEELGRSEAFGTSHFSDETVVALTTLAEQSSNGQRVNSIFGEGVSPKLRKVRQGLDLLGLDSDVLLKHYRHRIVYGVQLAHNAADYLIGLEDRPKYAFALEDVAASTSAIATWWRERWFKKRILSDDVLNEVQRHTLIRPIEHGARVVRTQRHSAQDSSTSSQGDETRRGS